MIYMIAICNSDYAEIISAIDEHTYRNLGSEWIVKVIKDNFSDNYGYSSNMITIDKFNANFEKLGIYLRIQRF